MVLYISTEFTNKKRVYEMARIEFYIECFDRDLVIEIQKKFKEQAEILLQTCYDYWIAGSEDVVCECCEEYMCDCLRKSGLVFNVIEEV